MAKSMKLPENFIKAMLPGICVTKSDGGWIVTIQPIPHYWLPPEKHEIN